ncbi:MAG TPA: MoaD/ThiS family protein [Caulobacteraceae bacterium]|nr:MoaD/ThiS family protein [Caulobacteraceae bacterium]
MATIAFTPHLRQVGPTRPTACGGATLGEALQALEPDYPLLRGYLLDDQGRLRRHVAVFVDGVMRSRETALGLALSDNSDVYIFQALSGG